MQSRRRSTPSGRIRSLVVVVGALAIIAASCSSDDDGNEASETTTTSVTSSSAEPVEGTVGVADTEFGEVLTDDLGYTLYVFDQDIGQPGPTCVDECSDKWPPYIVGEIDPTDGLDADLGTVDRGDGFEQLTVNGRPAYTMTEETEPGQTLCQGGDGVWWIVGTDGEAISETDSVPTPDDI